MNSTFVIKWCDSFCRVFFVLFAGLPRGCFVSSDQRDPMEDNQKILKLGKIDLVEYLNKVHISPDSFLVETQKHNLLKYQDQLNKYLHGAFVENCDELLAILDIYKYCHAMIQTIHPPKLVVDDPELDVHGSGCKEFVRACRPFEDNMDPFVTTGRFLIREDVFGELYCVLTNDLLFIGEENKEAHDEGGQPRYTLRSSFGTGVIDVARAEGCLRISTGTGLSYTLKGDEDELDEFYDAYQETVYEYPQDADGGKEPGPSMDTDLVEYFVATEQIGRLKRYAEGQQCPEKIVLGSFSRLKIADAADLKTAMSIFENPQKIFNSFILDRFSDGLQNLNKIQRVQSLLNDSFDYLEAFVELLEGVAAETGVSRRSFVLCVEELVLCLFGSVEKRVFNKFYEISINNSNLRLIEDRLRFRSLDFRYLTQTLLARRDSFSKACVENAKKEIKEKVDSLC